MRLTRPLSKLFLATGALQARHTASRVLISSAARVSLDMRSFEAYKTGQGRNSHPSEDLQRCSSGMRFSGSARILTWRSDDLRILAWELCGIGQ
jgi:hypothetical protein